MTLCPYRFCNGHDPAQNLVSEQQAELVNEPALAGAIICSSCGTVWVRDPRNQRHILGTLRRTGRSYEWKTAYKVPAP
jgi:hypothetical protein